MGTIATSEPTPRHTNFNSIKRRVSITIDQYLPRDSSRLWFSSFRLRMYQDIDLSHRERFPHEEAPCGSAKIARSPIDTTAIDRRERQGERRAILDKEVGTNERETGGRKRRRSVRHAALVILHIPISHHASPPDPVPVLNKCLRRAAADR